MSAAMCLYVVVVALLLVPCCCRAVVVSDEGVSDSLMSILDIKKINNNTQLRIPDYMYRLYQDTGNQKYDVIRNIFPTTESLGTHTLLIYDLDTLEPTEIIQKAVVQLDSNVNYRYGEAVNVTFFSLTKQKPSKTYLGSASIHDTLDLADTLGSQSLVGLNQLGIEVENQVQPSLGLVLYSITTASSYAKAHELAELLVETKMNPIKRHKRSIEDNEINTKQKSFTDESKRRKRKKKGSRVSKLQAVDNGDTIVFTLPNQCQMKKLALNFADIGWEDWVIYPKGFETNYCAGRCLQPLDKGSRPTNHATIQSLARSFGRLWDLPEPGCVPDKLAPLTLLYMDHSNHVLLKNYPDMIVCSCGCK